MNSSELLLINFIFFQYISSFFLFFIIWVWMNFNPCFFFVSNRILDHTMDKRCSVEVCVVAVSVWRRWEAATYPISVFTCTRVLPCTLPRQYTSTGINLLLFHRLRAPTSLRISDKTRYRIYHFSQQLVYFSYVTWILNIQPQLHFRIFL